MADAKVKKVETNGFSMDYIRFGKGGQPLVILPGLSVESVSKYADAVIGAYHTLAELFSIYVFDRRASLPEEYPVSHMAADTADAMRTLGLGHAYLFGASQGGMMAMLIAAEHPELVDKLVLGSTSCRMDSERCAVIDLWTQLARNGDTRALYDSFGKAIYPPGIYERMRSFLQASAEGITQEELDRFVVLAEGSRGFDARDELASVRCPVLLMDSRDDRVLGADAADEVAAHLSNASDFQRHTYDGYGHAAYDTAPDYKDRMRAFLIA